MKDSCAVLRIARETISCSCSEVMFHFALSRVMPRQAMGTDSKLTGAGGVSVGGLRMTFTAGVGDLALVGVAASVWTACSRCPRKSGTDSECRCRPSSRAGSKAGVAGDERARELSAGEFVPE